jgi:hypothetical protein
MSTPPRVNVICAGASPSPKCSSVPSWRKHTIPALPSDQTYTSATLRLYNPPSGFFSQQGTENLRVVDVVSQLGPSNTAIYADLGTGVVYADRLVSAADNNTNVSTTLNADAVTAINADAGHSFALGGSLTTLLQGGNNEQIFANTGDTPLRQLVLTTSSVPEPATLSTFALGGALTLFPRRPHRPSVGVSGRKK